MALRPCLPPQRLIDDFLAKFGGETQPIMIHLIEAERHLREIARKGKKT